MVAAIRIEGLSKRYAMSRQGGRARYARFSEALTSIARAPLRALRGGAKTEDFWALSDVSFDVGEGQVMGVIGRNGAGKSTLLKVLSRIIEPTRGRAAIYGRVASLLEVGTGFHPELTGRENVFLNGAVLGMSRPEIRARFDEIIAFADVAQFLDTPIKRYSSGMYVRLAFAVAAHLAPEILLVDEVLAVGDAEFQKKCLGKMQSVTTEEGRTVIFVSHNMSAVASLCHSAVLLERGRVLAHGPAREVLAKYANTATAGAEVDLGSLVHGGAREHARLTSLTVLDEHDAPCTSFEMGRGIRVRVAITCTRRLARGEVGVKINSLGGVAIHYLVSAWEGLEHDFEAGEHVVEVRVPKLLLLPGRYLLSPWVLRRGHPADDHVQDATTIEVLSADVNGHHAEFQAYASSGCEVYVPSEWKVVDFRAAPPERAS